MERTQEKREWKSGADMEAHLEVSSIFASPGVERNLKLNGVEATSRRLLGGSILDDGCNCHSNDRD
jgi:hypothetical protein